MCYDFDWFRLYSHDQRTVVHKDIWFVDSKDCLGFYSKVLSYGQPIHIYYRFIYNTATAHYNRGSFLPGQHWPIQVNKGPRKPMKANADH